MSTFSALENSPILVNLVTQANDTGWSLPDGINALHSCNPGNLILTPYPVIGGNTYQVSYIVNSISGGNVQIQSPGANGVARTTPALYVESITPTSNGFISFYSNATCSITAFNIVPVSTAPGTTIVFSPFTAPNGKWSDFRSYYPDFGWSLYTRTIVGYQGQLYSFENGGGANTNNFFGTQYQSSIKFVEAKNPDIIKDFEALNYQANMLLVSTPDGIQSSLGQISTLIDTDFIKQNLVDGPLQVILYQKDQVYSASFLNDENEDIVNGSQLRGNFLIVELITFDGSTPLTLFSVAVRSKYVPIGAR